MRFDWFEKTNKGDTSNEGRWGTFLKWVDRSGRWALTLVSSDDNVPGDRVP
jgi:hypothetical protein